MGRPVDWSLMPERVDDLWLDITAQPSQPHFAVDAAWPPHGHYKAPPEQRAPKVEKPPRKPYVFPPGHPLAEWCLICGAAPGKMCREIDRRSWRYGLSRNSHRERYDLVAITLEIQRLEQQLEAMK